MNTTKALTLVDFENEWTDENSSYFVGDISEAIINVNQLIDLCREKGYRIIFTTHVELDSDGEFVQGSKNKELRVLLLAGY